MRKLWLFPLAFTLGGFIVGTTPPVGAFEEGEFTRTEGRWQYVTADDPGLKYLLQKGIITQEEYDKGAKLLETRQHLLRPNYDISWNNGLNIKTGDRFLLKIRTFLQFQYNLHDYNLAWRTIGDQNNYASSAATVIKHNESTADTFDVRRVRLSFLGYAFDPDLRYNLTLQADQSEGSTSGTGNAALFDAYVASWHIPYANLWVGQYRVWFNRQQISSVATRTFVDRSPVSEAFVANVLNRRDIGITLLSDESRNEFNYAIGAFNGTGINEDRLGVPSNNPKQGVGLNANELMYVARLLWNVSGRPGYGEGDIEHSRIPQVAIAAGYAYNPGMNFVNPNTPVTNALTTDGNGRLVGAGIIDFQTSEFDVIAKYQGWALQAEGYIRQQQARGGNNALGTATGWYVQLGNYLIPHKMELAVRYGIFNPNDRQSHDLLKEGGVALNYNFEGDYNHRLVMDFINTTMGTGGYAAGRTTVSTQDLVENRFRLQYQFYW